MAHKVFICHSSHDKLVANAACAALEAQRIPCWIAPRDVLGGTEWGKSIIEAIATCEVVLLIFSRQANESPQVRREIERAVSKGRIIVPFRIEEALPSDAMEYALSNTHWLDALNPPMELHLAELSRTILRLLGHPSDADPLFQPQRPPAPPAPAPSPKPPLPPPAPARRQGPFLWIAIAILLMAGSATAAVMYFRSHDAAPVVTPAPATPLATPTPPRVVQTPNNRIAPPRKAITPSTPIPSAPARTTPNPPPAIIVAPPEPPKPTAPEPPKLTPEQKNALDQIEMNLDQISSQAVGVNSSLQNMQNSMQRDGMSMRGDIVASRASLNNSLTKARQALQANDPDRAGRFAAQAQSDLNVLQKFLGR